jgi:class 3 adenylate cyclase
MHAHELLRIVRPGEADDFEQQRRRRETRNELFINAIFAAGLFVLGVAHTLNYYFAWAPFRSPRTLPTVLAVAFGISAARIAWLRGDPPYHPLRKYLITLFEFVVFLAAYMLLATVLPPMLLGVLPAPLGMLLIILGGLRYSTGVVVLTGALALTIHFTGVALLAPDDYRVGLALVGGMALTATTLVTILVVTSLIGLHREAIWKERLSRFLAPELVEEIGRKPELLERRSEQRVATVLFADIHGFTALSERLPPSEVVALLNLFLSEMTGAIMNHRGMLDKYIGDAVMAVFGVPLASDDHAQLAFRTAREMCARMKGLNVALQRRGREPLVVGIGVHTGEVVAGVVGAAERLEYTVIGDTVNVAHRLAALTRDYGVEVLLSAPTRAALGDGAGLRELGTVAVRGRAQPLGLWTAE